MWNWRQRVVRRPRTMAGAGIEAGAARGFTLIELLLVVAILGVLMAVILPQFNVGMSGARVRAAALGYMQAARYARTMALLHQVEVELVCEAGGVVRVEAGAARGEMAGPYIAPEDAADFGASGGGGTRAASNTSSRLLSLAQPGASAFDNTGVGALAARYTPPDVSAEELASEGDPAANIRADQKFEDVHVRFLGYTDAAEITPAAGAESEGGEDFRIRYRSNGTSRPYRVRIEDDQGMALVIQVDMLGGAVIEGEQDE